MIHLYAGPQIRTGSSAIYEIVDISKSHLLVVIAYQTARRLAFTEEYALRNDSRSSLMRNAMTTLALRDTPAKLYTNKNIMENEKTRGDGETDRQTDRQTERGGGVAK